MVSLFLWYNDCLINCSAVRFEKEAVVQNIIPECPLNALQENADADA
jgi:hypothetical protein